MLLPGILLRLGRILKALNNIPAYQRVCMVIMRMISTCSDVLLMNLLVIYLWSALGVQLFGGKWLLARLLSSLPSVPQSRLGTTITTTHLGHMSSSDF